MMKKTETQVPALNSVVSEKELVSLSFDFNRLLSRPWGWRSEGQIVTRYF